MHVSLNEAFAALSGGTVWMVYAAIWKHCPTLFPRTIDAWWAWIRGANQEIAAQHGGGTAGPTTPVEPAQTKS